MVRYVIFDFDGTLADTNAGIVRTFQASFRHMGLEIPDTESIKATIGLILHDAFKVLLNDNDDEHAEAGAEIYRSLYNDIAFPLIKAFDGVPEVLSEIRSRGIKMAIATSRSHLTLEKLATLINIKDYFEGMFASEDVTRHKPDPEMVNMILSRFNLNPDEALVVGDATYDLLMGKNAGCRVCGVTWGNQTREKLSSVKPDYIIDSMYELLNLPECLL